MKENNVVTSDTKGSSAKEEIVIIVSGRNMYDAFGRVAKAFYPTTEGTGSKSTFNKSFDNVSPTVTVYDVLDRATSVTLPDNSTTTTAYTVDNGSHALVTTVTDALHNVQATHTNGSGQTLKAVQSLHFSVSQALVWHYPGLGASTLSGRMVPKKVIQYSVFSFFRDSYPFYDYKL